MSIDPENAALLACPESLQPLEVASPEQLEQLNLRIDRGELRTHSGNVVQERLAGALIREDGACAYRVLDGYANLLLEDRIELGS